MRSRGPWAVLAAALCIGIVGCGGGSDEGSSGESRPAEGATQRARFAPRFHGTRIEDFSQVQAAPGAVAEVPEPLGGPGRVLAMTVDDGDVYPITPTENPRAQLSSPANIEPGDDLWWSTEFLLPGSFPSYVPGWVTVMEGPYGPPYEETPPWHLEVHEGRIQWSRNGTYGFDVPWQMPLVRDEWITVVVHTRFATDGFVEMWVDGKQVTFFPGDTRNPTGIAPTHRLQMETMDSTNDEAPNSIYIQNYREVGMFETVETYARGLTIGHSRASVERALRGGRT
jgi:hypothetical protein